jgi:hypothetical protein
LSQSHFLVFSLILISGLLIIIPYLYFRGKIKASLIRVPRRSGKLSYRIIRLFFIFQGLLLIISSPAAGIKLISEPLGQPLLGLLLVMAGIFRNPRYRLLISQDAITFLDRGARCVWKTKEIDSVTIGRNRVDFHKKDASRRVDFMETELDFPIRIKQIMMKLMGN